MATEGGNARYYRGLKRAARSDLLLGHPGLRIVGIEGFRFERTSSFHRGNTVNLYISTPALNLYQQLLNHGVCADDLGLPDFVSSVLGVISSSGVDSIH